jgi:polyisoprenoid-binding protein YceI
MRLELTQTVLLLSAALLLATASEGLSQDAAFSAKTMGPQTFNAEDKVGRNQVLFRSKAPMEDIFGAAAGVSGFVTLDPASPEKTARGEIIIQANSMSTGLKQRDRDMLGEQWLDVGRYQTIKFKLKKLSGLAVQSKNLLQGNATGDFTMHGVTKTITIPVSLKYLEESPETQMRAPGDFLVLRSKFSVKFEDYNIEGVKNYFGVRVARTIDLEVNLCCTNKAYVEE